MSSVIHAIYDGHTLHPEDALPYPPNTRLRLVVEQETAVPAGKTSFVDVVGSLNLQGPEDWSSNLDEYLSGLRDIDAGK